MKAALAATLVAAAALITAALLLLLPISASYSGVPVTCGTLLASDTKKAEHTDELHNLGDHGFKASCDSAAASRFGWGIGLGAVGVLAGVGAGVLFARRASRRPAAV